MFIKSYTNYPENLTMVRGFYLTPVNRFDLTPVSIFKILFLGKFSAFNSHR